MKTDESGEELDTITASVFRQVLKSCLRLNLESSLELLELIKSSHILQTNVESRAFFRKHFCQHFGLAFGAAKRALRALQFLCRFYSAVSTFIEAASRISAFRTISFVPVRCFEQRMKRDEGTSNQAISEALVSLGVSKNRDLIAARFKQVIEDPATRKDLEHTHQGKGGVVKTVDEIFHKSRSKLCHVHAEIQLVDIHENHLNESNVKWRVHPYIGCSKLCCYLCHTFLRHHGFFSIEALIGRLKVNGWCQPCSNLSRPPRPSSAQFIVLMARSQIILGQ